jgi:hypothetical protein
MEASCRLVIHYAKQFFLHGPSRAVRFREGCWFFRALDSLPAPVPGGG